MPDLIVRDIDWGRRDAELKKRERDRGFEPWKEEALAQVFEENGSIDDPHRPGHVLVHRWGLLQSRESVFKAGIAVAPGDWVRIGYSPKPHDRWRILSLYDGEMTRESADNYTTHDSSSSESYQPITQSSLTPLRVTGNGSDLKISIQPLIYRYGDRYRRFSGGKLDMTSYLPSSGNSVYVLVYLGIVSGAISRSSGTEFTTGSQGQLPLIPSGAIPAAFILLDDDQTSITTTDHVTDARPFLGESGASGAATFVEDLADVNFSSLSDGDILVYDADNNQWVNSSSGGGASAIDDLSDVAISSPADDEVLAYDNASGEWINQTAAEAGLAEDDHTHTESDITDLDHWDGADTQGVIDSYVDKAFVDALDVDADTLDGQDSTDFAAASHTHTESDISDLDHTDDDAIHDNVAGEIAAITEKASPVAADKVLIEDSEDSDSKKYAELGNLPGGSSGSKYRQFVYEVSGGDFSFVIDQDGNPVMALQELE